MKYSCFCNVPDGINNLVGYTKHLCININDRISTTFTIKVNNKSALPLLKKHSSQKYNKSLGRSLNSNCNRRLERDGYGCVSCLLQKKPHPCPGLSVIVRLSNSPDPIRPRPGSPSFVRFPFRPHPGSSCPVPIASWFFLIPVHPSWFVHTPVLLS